MGRWSKMNCPNCGTVNSQDSKFCIKCGNSLLNENNNIEKNEITENIDIKIQNQNITISLNGTEKTMLYRRRKQVK